jgi:hypothetical protein
MCKQQEMQCPQLSFSEVGGRFTRVSAWWVPHPEEKAQQMRCIGLATGQGSFSTSVLYLLPLVPNKHS